eukprot:768767-Hanusia_phi.AAC.2
MKLTPRHQPVSVGVYRVEGMPDPLCRHPQSLQRQHNLVGVKHSIPVLVKLVERRVDPLERVQPRLPRAALKRQPRTATSLPPHLVFPGLSSLALLRDAAWTLSLSSCSKRPLALTCCRISMSRRISSMLKSAFSSDSFGLSKLLQLFQPVPALTALRLSSNSPPPPDFSW